MPSRYERIIERIFFKHYVDGAESVSFERGDMVAAAAELGMALPKNLGDVVYSFRYRVELPQSVQEKAPHGKAWIIRPEGTAKYAFVATAHARIAPNPLIAETKIPDATPGVIGMYAQGDEQALLAKVRYNRLIDVFTGVTCFSLQNHLRTTVPGMGQVEVDELYVGVDQRGAHYVFPVSAKGGRDSLGVVQIEQDIAVCRSKFPSLICRAIGAQFMSVEVISLFAFEQADPEGEVSLLNTYRKALQTGLSGRSRSF